MRPWEGSYMQINKFLRPAQKILTGVVVAVVTGACVLSATSSTSLATKEWKSHSTTNVATKRGKAPPGTEEGMPPSKPVAQRASPAMGPSSYERATLHAINGARAAHHLR